MKKHNVLLTCMGGYGGEYLAENIRNSDIGDQINFVGTHVDPYFLSTSSAPKNYVVPYAKDEKKYVSETVKIIEKEKIDFFIPKSDREVTVTSKYRSKFPCKLFLPEEKEIVASQDKMSFYDMLKDTGVGVAKTFVINSVDEIGSLMKKISSGNKFWVRVKSAGEAGAVTATWVESAEQARMWIKLWQEIRNFNISDFTISEFLSGRLFECLVLFKDGDLKVAKLYENLRYYGAAQRVSGMASTPDVAKTSIDPEGVEALHEAVRAVKTIANYTGTKPHGIYHLSAKFNYDNKPCLTESNIGRFPSTCAFFDRTGKVSAAERFIKFGLGIPVDDLENPYDLDDSETYMIWTLGKKLQLKSQEDIDNCKSITAQ